MRRRDCAWLAASALLANCARKVHGPQRTVRVGVNNYPGMSPFYIALERGYFRDSGFDAQPSISVRSGDLVALLTAGSLDAAITLAAPPFFNAVARGANVRVVMGREVISLSCGDAGGLYAHKAAFPHGTSDVRHWAGKKIWCGQGATTAEFLLDRILTRSGLEAKATAHPQINQSQAAAALLSGAIDGMLNANNVPFDFSDRPDIVHEVGGRPLLAGLQISGVLFGASFLKGNASDGGRFLGCLLRGAREFEAGVTPQFLRNFAAAQSRGDSILRACRAYNAANGAIDRESLRLMLEWAAAKDYCPGGVSTDSLVDDRFLAVAVKEAGG